MQAIIFAVISYLGWGIGDIFGTIATRKIGAYQTTFWYLLLQIPLFGIFAFFFTDKLANLTIGVLIINIFLGILGTVGFLAFYEGLRIGNASLVGTIVASFAAVTVILSLIFLKESLTAVQTTAIIIIFFGLITSTFNFNELRRGEVKLGKGVLFAIIAMLVWGIYWAFIKIPVEQIGWFWPIFISLTSFPLVPLFMKYRKIQLELASFKRALLPLLLNAILLGIAAFSFNFAIDINLTAIVAPIAGSYPTLFVLLAFLIFKDPITRQQVVGIVTTLIGIVLLSIFSI